MNNTAFNSILAMGQMDTQGHTVADGPMMVHASVVASHGELIADALLQAAELVAALENVTLHYGDQMPTQDRESRMALVDGMRAHLATLGVQP